MMKFTVQLFIVSCLIAFVACGFFDKLAHEDAINDTIQSNKFKEVVTRSMEEVGLSQEQMKEMTKRICGFLWKCG